MMPSDRGEKAATAAANGHVSDNDYSDNETMSVVSTQSEDGGGQAEGGDDVDESSSQEILEDKLKEVIDGLTQKRW